MILLFLIKELEKITFPLGSIIFLLQYTNETSLYSLKIETCVSKHLECKISSCGSILPYFVLINVKHLFQFLKILIFHRF